ncbi:hypothetical protein K443DRAFT_117648, partial [Laccaria amethystina LaAM-08-1]
VSDYLFVFIYIYPHFRIILQRRSEYSKKNCVVWTKIRVVHSSVFQLFFILFFILFFPEKQHQKEVKNEPKNRIS